MAKDLDSKNCSRTEYLFQYFAQMGDEELKKELRSENLKTSGTRRQRVKRLRDHYRTAVTEIRKRYPNRSRTQDFYNYFIVIDFECSCEANNYDFEHEIIDFPAVLVSVHSQKIVDTFHTYVRPVERPKLTEFCTKLTGITQAMVDRAPTFPEALDKFRVWMAKHGLDGRDRATGHPKRFCYVTDGPWDIAKFMQMQCIKSGLKLPHDFRHYLNIRRSFVNFYCHAKPGHEAPEKLPNTELNTLLARLGLQFEGKEHCGMDDSRNIARILVRMLEDGAELRANEKLVRSGHLREGQKLVFDDTKRAPCLPVSASQSVSYEEIAESIKSKLHLDDGGAMEESTSAGATAIVWTKWWDQLPYKLVKITRLEFLGEQHLECESCDDWEEEQENEREKEDEDVEW